MPDNELTPRTEESISELGGIPSLTMSMSPAGFVQTPVDRTLSIEGMAADAKAVGDAIRTLDGTIAGIESDLDEGYVRVTEQEFSDEAIAQVHENIRTIDLIYPVGSIYMSMSGVNPGNMWPGTTWTKLTDRFLYAAGDADAPGSIGGSQSYNYTPTGTIGGTTLTAGQSGLRSHTHNHSITLPDHTHKFTNPSISNVTLRTTMFMLQTTQTGGLVITYPDQNGNDTSGLVNVQLGNGEVRGVDASVMPQCTGIVQSVTAQNATESHSHTFIGGQATIPTMPPFVAVNIWQRTV